MHSAQSNEPAASGPAGQSAEWEVLLAYLKLRNPRLFAADSAIQSLLLKRVGG